MADINNPQEFLKEALQLTDSLSADRTEAEQAAEQAQSLEKALNTLRDNLAREKERTVKARRADVESEFNKKIKAKAAELDKAETKRSKAREKGVNSRVADQTAGLKGEIRNSRNSLSDYCTQNKLPGVCRTGLFYSLYYPSSAGDWIRLIIIAAAMLAALIGAFMYQSIPVFIIVLAAVALLLVLYAFIGSRTKGRYHEQLKNCRAMIADIRRNKKGVKRVTRTIRRDKSDAAYDLSEFDAELAKLKAEQSELTAQKTSALYSFDTVTGQQLAAEIDNTYAGKLKSAEEAFLKAKQELDAVRQRVSETENRLNTEFVQYLGSKNMNHEKIVRLTELINSGESASISDAVTRLDEEKDKN